MRHDRNALEGMPLKLVIVSMMVSLAIPAVYGALGNFRSISAELMLQDKVSELSKVAESCFNDGPGNVRTVAVDLPEGTVIIIGGDGSDTMSISYLLPGGAPVKTYLTDPCIRFIVPDGGLRLEAAIQTVRLSCVMDGDRPAIKAMV